MLLQVDSCLQTLFVKVCLDTFSSECLMGRGIYNACTQICGVPAVASGLEPIALSNHGGGAYASVHCTPRFGKSRFGGSRSDRMHGRLYYTAHASFPSTCGLLTALPGLSI